MLADKATGNIPGAPLHVIATISFCQFGQITIRVKSRDFKRIPLHCRWFSFQTSRNIFNDSLESSDFQLHWGRQLNPCSVEGKDYTASLKPLRVGQAFLISLIFSLLIGTRARSCSVKFCKFAGVAELSTWNKWAPLVSRWPVGYLRVLSILLFKNLFVGRFYFLPFAGFPPLKICVTRNFLAGRIPVIQEVFPLIKLEGIKHIGGDILRQRIYTRMYETLRRQSVISWRRTQKWRWSDLDWNLMAFT